MKIEPTRDLQVNRIDDQKSNKIAIVRSLPNNGTERDIIHLGELPEQPETPKDGYYYRLSGKWRYLGDGVGITADTDPSFVGKVPGEE